MRNITKNATKGVGLVGITILLVIIAMAFNTMFPKDTPETEQRDKVLASAYEHILHGDPASALQYFNPEYVGEVDPAEFSRCVTDLRPDGFEYGEIYFEPREDDDPDLLEGHILIPIVNLEAPEHDHDHTDETHSHEEDDLDYLIAEVWAPMVEIDGEWKIDRFYDSSAETACL